MAHARRFIWLTLALLAAGCVAGRPPGGMQPADWPYSDYRRVSGGELQFFQDRFFSGEGMLYAPGSDQLWSPSEQPGALSFVDGERITAVYDFGPGSQLERFVFSPDRQTLYLVANTVEGRNIGNLPLARALLEVDLGLELLRPPVPLVTGGFSRSLALQADRGWLYSLDTAGPDRSTHAWISRIDLYGREVSLQRTIGSVPFLVRRHGLIFDARQNRLYALLGGGVPTDFDPPGEDPSTNALVVLSPDSLTVIDRLPLAADVDYMAIVPSPRGVVVAGIDSRPGERRTRLMEIDTRLMQEVSWLDLPEAATDIAASGPRAILPVRRGLFLVDLEFLTVARVIPLPVERVGDVTMTEDARRAALMIEDPDVPGRPVLAFVDLVNGRLERILR